MFTLRLYFSLHSERVGVRDTWMRLLIPRLGSSVCTNCDTNHYHSRDNRSGLTNAFFLDDEICQSALFILSAFIFSKMQESLAANGRTYGTYEFAHKCSVGYYTGRIVFLQFMIALENMIVLRQHCVSTKISFTFINACFQCRLTLISSLRLFLISKD